jgi:hypothetical protein
VSFVATNLLKSDKCLMFPAGGVETQINEYPSMAGVVDSQERRIFCGATISELDECFSRFSLNIFFSLKHLRAFSSTLCGGTNNLFHGITCW